LQFAAAIDCAHGCIGNTLSGAPSEDRYRISIKRETHGTAGAYLDTQVRVGDVIEVSAPRGNFTPGPGSGPVVSSASCRLRLVALLLLGDPLVLHLDELLLRLQIVDFVANCVFRSDP
jgi:hypothetical protein